MYAREIDRKTEVERKAGGDREVRREDIVFAVSGLLWNDSLVMIDTSTGSLWSHIYGEAMLGQLKGTKLRQLPATVTQWSRWKETHPETTAVHFSRIGKVYYTDYHKALDKFVLGASVTKEDGATIARAWPFDELIHKPIVNDRVDESPVLVLFNIENITVSIFSRTVDEKTLSFQQRDGKLIDQETESVWDRETGIAIDGPLKGRQLNPFLAKISYRHAWEIFYPDTDYFSADR